MSDKNANRLREELELLDEQLERNLSIIEERKQSIIEKKLENKNHKEKILFLHEELSMKRSEYSEKIDKIQKKTREEKETKKDKELQKENEKKETFNIAEVTKLVDMYRTSHSFEIVEGIINDYSKLTSEMDKIFYENEKQNNIDEIGFVYIKYEDSIVSFRIIDDYYTFSDLLFEACQYFEVKIENFRIYDNEGKLINMILSVKSHMQNLREITGSVPNLTLQQICEDKDIKVHFNQNKENLDLPILEIETADLLDQIENVESELLEKLKKIIFYLVFLSLIFVYNMSNAKVKQIYHITKAFNNQIIDKNFFRLNQYGLENSFATISRIDDLMAWGFGAFTDMFNFKEASSQNNTEIELTSILLDYLVIGRISFMHTRLNKTDNFKYALQYSDHSQVFDNYKDFLNLRPISPPISYTGTLSSYSFDQAYTINIMPQLREIHLILSMFKNIDIYSPEFELLRIQIVSYNFNDDILATITFTVEQNANGNIAVNNNLCVITFMTTIKNLITFEFSSTILFTTGFVLLTFLYSLFGVYDIIINIKKLRWKYFLKFWNIVFVCKILVYIAGLLLRVSMYLDAYYHLRWVDESEILDTSVICSLLQFLQILEMIMICLTLIFFLNYLDSNIVGPIFDTLFKSLKNILVFITSYIFIIIGFAFFCNYIYGISASKLRTLDGSIIQLFLMVFGDFSIIPKMADMFLYMTLIFEFVFSLTFFMLFANWLIGTIVQWYDIDRKDKKFTKARSGTISVNFFDEILLVRKKYIRSILLFITRIINYIKEIKNLRMMKKNQNKNLNKDEAEKLKDIRDEGENDSDEDEDKFDDEDVDENKIAEDSNYSNEVDNQNDRSNNKLKVK